MSDPTYGSALLPTPYSQQHRALLPYAPAAPAQPCPPTPTRRTLLQAWIIGFLLALLLATGIGIVLVLTDDSSGVADPPTQGAPGAPDNPANSGNGPAADPREVPSPPTDCLVECTGPEGPDGSPAPDGNYAGSDDAAADFLQAIVNDDSVSAHSSLCGAGINRFPTPEDLVADFYATLGFSTITGARLTDVYAADSTLDAVVFDLETDIGDVLVEVYVVEEESALTVCGYGGL